MVSVADDIVQMITARTTHTGGTIDLSESLDNLGLDFNGSDFTDF